MTHKSTLSIDHPKFEFIDTESNSSFFVNDQYCIESVETETCTTSSTNQFRIDTVAEPDPLDLCEIKIELNTLEFDYLTDIKREESSFEQQAQDGNYAYISMLNEHSYAKTYRQGLKEIEKLFEDQRNINNNVEASFNYSEAQNLISERIATRKRVIGEDDDLCKENVLSKQQKLDENTKQIVPTFVILNEEEQCSVHDLNDVIICDVLIEPEHQETELQELNTNCLNTTKEAFVNQPATLENQSSEARSSLNKVTEPTNHLMISEIQPNVFRNQSKEVCSEIIQPKVLETHLEFQEQDGTCTRLDGNELEVPRVADANKKQLNVPENNSAETSLRLGERCCDQSGESTNHSELSKNKHPLLLKTLYIKESAVQVSNDLSAKAIESGTVNDEGSNNDGNKTIKSVKTILYKCINCSFSTPHEAVIKMHTRIHTKIKQKPPHCCDKCSYKTPHKRELIIHLKTHRPEINVPPKEIKTYDCPKCSNKFKSKHELFKHLSSHAKDSDHPPTINNVNPRTPEFSYECETCKYRSTDELVMKYHIETHMLEKTYQCNQCSFTTQRKRDFNLHSKAHEKTPYTCPKCNYNTESNKRFITHTQVHCISLSELIRTEESEPVEKQNFNCRLCGFTADTAHQMENHMVKHARKKSYRCYTCDFVSWYADELVIHKQLHVEVAQCPVCKETMTRAEFDKHRIIHAVECKECNFIAGSEEILKVHLMDVHTVHTFRRV